MEKNNTLKEIGQELIKADSVLIFPHILMDGDALGSAVAMCIAMRQRGKTAYVVTEDKTADYLKFMTGDHCMPVEKCNLEPDVSMCIDCGDEGRFPRRAGLFNSGKKTICIDHHSTSEGIADLNYINEKASATGEIVYDLLTENEMEISTEMAECLFAAIATDTGNYMYSNTTRRSHEITMALMDIGVDCNKISVAIYENESVEKMLLQSNVLAGMKRFADGKGVIASVTEEMLKENNALMEDTEGLVGKLRSLKGVEISVLLKENRKKNIKVAMRVKQQGDVAAIAKKYNGGGHVKSAGCTIDDTIENAESLMIKEVTEALRKE
ncbi:MAG: bifunctional oligoribonuclease/PAP phosphatase NrnA [Eubacteriaceae bacterium]|nr:bifunctional oligoribonuclease/PAP phosphatase NrnA [Eubacteriaceae bacterium]